MVPGVNPLPHLSLRECEEIADENLRKASFYAKDAPVDEADALLARVHADVAKAATALAAYKRNMGQMPVTRMQPTSGPFGRAR